MPMFFRLGTIAASGNLLVGAAGEMKSPPSFVALPRLETRCPNLAPPTPCTSLIFWIPSGALALFVLPSVCKQAMAGGGGLVLLGGQLPSPTFGDSSSSRQSSLTVWKILLEKSHFFVHPRMYARLL